MSDSKRKLYIRTEANEIIATGHMMRCLSIADAASDLGVTCVFIVAEQQSLALPESRGYEVICLNHPWDDFDGEIPLMEDIIRKFNIEVLLVDSYYVTQKYMQALHRLTKTAYIDDLHEAVWPCSMLIDYAVYSDYFPYKEEYPKAQLLLGCEYMPLRKEYKNLPVRVIRKKVKEILMLTGGADPQHFMRLAVQMIKENRKWENIHFTLICGRYNTDLNRLTEETEAVNNITVYPSLPSLKEALLEADIVITAGGTTLYEMAACGTPGIVFQLAENQKWNVKAFSENGLALNAGEMGNDFSIERLEYSMDRLIEDEMLREEMARRLQGLVDGNGGERIVRELIRDTEVCEDINRNYHKSANGKNRDPKN